MNIDKIQPNYIFKVDPVNFFEAGKQRQTGKNNSFNSGLFTQLSNEAYNLNHPKVAGSETQAKSLDLLA